MLLCRSAALSSRLASAVLTEREPQSFHARGSHDAAERRHWIAKPKGCPVMDSQRAEVDAENGKFQRLNTDFPPGRVGKVGLRITQASDLLGHILGVAPYVVKSVRHLTDMNGVQQGQPGYNNPEIVAGDELISVDGHNCASMSLEGINRLLQGFAYTVVVLTLARKRAMFQTTGVVYSVRIMRHPVEPGSESRQDLAFARLKDTKSSDETFGPFVYTRERNVKELSTGSSAERSTGKQNEGLQGSKENGFLGIEVTKTLPHAVLAVHDLLDCNFVCQGDPRYLNEEIKPGDCITSVNGMPALHVSVKKLHAMLRGPKHTEVELTLARGGDGGLFTVRVLRHGCREGFLSSAAEPRAIAGNTIAPSPKIAASNGVSYMCAGELAAPSGEREKGAEAQQLRPSKSPTQEHHAPSTSPPTLLVAGVPTTHQNCPRQKSPLALKTPTERGLLYLLSGSTQDQEQKAKRKAEEKAWKMRQDDKDASERALQVHRGAERRKKAEKAAQAPTLQNICRNLGLTPQKQARHHSTPMSQPQAAEQALLRSRESANECSHSASSSCSSLFYGDMSAHSAMRTPALRDANTEWDRKTEKGVTYECEVCDRVFECKAAAETHEKRCRAAMESRMTQQLTIDVMAESTAEKRKEVNEHVARSPMSPWPWAASGVADGTQEDFARVIWSVEKAAEANAHNAIARTGERCDQRHRSTAEFGTKSQNHAIHPSPDRPASVGALSEKVGQLSPISVSSRPSSVADSLTDSDAASPAQKKKRWSAVKGFMNVFGLRKRGGSRSPASPSTSPQSWDTYTAAVKAATPITPPEMNKASPLPPKKSLIRPEQSDDVA